MSMATTRKPREDRRIIHETRVKVNLVRLREIVDELANELNKVGRERQTQEQRSKFHSWNTVSKFLERVDNGSDSVILENVSGGVTGNSARVYYFPSITSYCKAFRDCIVPLEERNKFLFFDLKAAEFFMNCVFCDEKEAISYYEQGEDIYMHYANLFPQGLGRSPIKTTLIANMYNTTPYRVGLNCGISEGQAELLLNRINRMIPSMTAKKKEVIEHAKKTNAYWCPNGLDQNDLIKVADVDPIKGFNENLALSAYVQSALGKWMQSFISDLASKTKRTVLTVFDSCLLEVTPENEEKAKAWIANRIKPFRIGDIGEGKTFLEAYFKG